MQNAHGTVRIADFGLARFVDDAAAALTSTGHIMGTSLYLAPERALGKPAGPGSDVYALGCVLYQLVVGEPPFKADTSTAVLHVHVDATPRHPRCGIRSCPGRSRSICSGCWRSSRKTVRARRRLPTGSPAGPGAPAPSRLAGPKVPGTARNMTQRSGIRSDCEAGPPFRACRCRAACSRGAAQGCFPAGMPRINHAVCSQPVTWQFVTRR
ncbi:protein kinase domain-containing protein [Streptomyces sp. KR80]|uniref:protein kinase domain-containing protein n=1 Tax=Streptomyces sp. KR80 TaxID=3457426 RepID=UPI003FD1F728